jgi:hypothetical protein
MSFFLVLALLLPLAVFLGDGKWRDAMLYCVVIGFLQDPLRKITPDQPALYAGLVLIGLSATGLVLYNRIGRLKLLELFAGDRLLVSVIEFFLGLVALQAVNSLLNLDSPYRLLIGLGFYGAPLLALWMGFQFGLQPESVRRFLWTYVIMALLFSVAFILDFRGYQGPLFEEIAGGSRFIRAGLTEYVSGYTGFWRNTEVAGWHLATCACFIFILAVQRRRPWPIALGSALVLTLMVLATLTGRRKALVLIVAFLAVFASLLAGRADRKVLLPLFGGLGGGLLLLTVFGLAVGNPTENSTLQTYFYNAQTISSEFVDRIINLGFETILYGYQTGGFFGLGLGAAAQGASSLGLASVASVGSAEGGLGKIMLELGVTGLLLLVTTAILLGRLYWKITKELRYSPPAYGIINLGLMAFLIANVMNFIVASQTYGDPFVLSMFGLCGGFILASQAVMKAHLRMQREAAGHFAAASRPVLPPPAPPGVPSP